MYSNISYFEMQNISLSEVLELNKLIFSKDMQEINPIMQQQKSMVMLEAFINAWAKK